MSDTPRTDAVLADTKYGDASDRISGLIELCHELERALSNTSKQRDEAIKTLRLLVDAPTEDEELLAWQNAMAYLESLREAE